MDSNWDGGLVESLQTQEPIENRIAGLIKNYPQDTLLSEYLQNADDAACTEIALQLDTNSYPTERLMKKDGGPKRKPELIQGPALYIYNNAVFQEKDWKGISDLGTGSKRTDLASVGKFGLGFNSSYNITDCPMILSGNYIYFPDVLKRFFPPTQDGTPGFRIPITLADGSVSPLVTKFPDQFAPFKKFGCQLDKPFQGTIFRLPLRNQIDSPIKLDSITTPDEIRVLFQVLIKQAPTMLLYLRNIQKLTVMENNTILACFVIPKSIGDNRSEKVKQITGHIKQLVQQVEARVSDTHKQLYEFKKLIGDNTHIYVNYPLKVDATIKDQPKVEYEWVITQGIISSKDLLETMLHESLKSEKLVPIGGIATPIKHPTPLKKFKGRPYCFLPIGNIETNLPVNINGYFILSDSRTDINLDTNQTTINSGYYQTRWNMLLLSQTISQLYTLNILEVKNYIVESNEDIPVSQLYKYIPCREKMTNPKFEQYVCLDTIKYLLQHPLFYNVFDESEWFELDGNIYVLNDTEQFILDLLQERSIGGVILPNSFIKFLENNGFEDLLFQVTREDICRILVKFPLKKFNGDIFTYLMDPNTIKNHHLDNVAIFPFLDKSLRCLTRSGLNDVYSTHQPTYGKKIFDIFKDEAPNLLLDTTIKVVKENPYISQLSEVGKYDICTSISLDYFLVMIKRHFPAVYTNSPDKSIPSAKLQQIGLKIDILWNFIHTHHHNITGHSKLNNMMIFPTNNNSYVCINHPRYLSEQLDSLITPLSPVLLKMGYVIHPKSHHQSKDYHTNSPIYIIKDTITSSMIALLDYEEVEQLRTYLIQSIGNINSRYYQQSFVETILELPIWKLFKYKGQPSYRSHTSIHSKSMCCTDTQLNKFSEYLTNQFVDISEFLLHNSILTPIKNTIKSFHWINFTYILKEISQLTIEIQKAAIEIVLNNPGQYEDKLGFNWVPTQGGKFQNPNVVFIPNDNTSIIKDIDQEDYLVSSEFMDIYLGTFSASNWGRVGIKDKLTLEWVEQIAENIEENESPQLYDAFVRYLSKYHSNHDQEKLKSTLQDISWVQVKLDHKYQDLEIEQPCLFTTPIRCQSQSYLKLCFMVSNIANLPETLANMLLDPPSLDMVLDQIIDLSEWFESNVPGMEDTQKQAILPMIKEIVEAVYKYLNDKISPRAPSLSNDIEIKLLNRKWVWCGSNFSDVQSVAVSGRSLDPYLFVLPQGYNYKYQSLIALFKIPSTYDSERYNLVLEKIYQDLDGISMDNKELHLVKSIFSALDPDLEKFKDSNLKVPTSGMKLIEKNKVLSSKYNKLNPYLEAKGFHLLHHDVFTAAQISKLGIQKDQQKMHSGKGFGQRVDLVPTIKNLLQDYNANSLLKEMVQNAEDAQATQAKVLFDFHDYSGVEGIANYDTQSCANFKNMFAPSILFYNNQVFKPEDYQNVQSVGNSMKSKNENTIGKFGMGINAMYNISDCPSLISGRDLCYFDPTQTHFSYNEKDNDKGKRFGLDELYGQEELLIPFNNLKQFGLDLSNPSNAYFNGTITRLPMRKQRDYNNSLSHWTSEKSQELITEFIKQMDEMLLFLSNMESIEIYVRQNGSNDIKLLYSIEMTSELPETSTIKYYLSRMNKFPINISTIKTFQIIDNRNPSCPIEKETQWYVGQMIGGDRTLDLYKKSISYSLPKRLPTGGVAFKIGSNEPFEGKPYCFLPLPIPTHLPIHIQGYFELDNTRSCIVDNIDDSKPIELITVNELENNDRSLRSKWNGLLFEEIIVPCYLDAIKNAQPIYHDQIDKYYALFPRESKGGIVRIIDTFYRNLEGRELFKVWQLPSDDSPSEWSELTPDTFVYTDDDNETIASMLKMDSVVIVYIPRSLLSLVSCKSKLSFKRVSPSDVRDNYIHKLKHHGYGFDIGKSPLPSLNNTNNIIYLFKYLSGVIQYSPFSNTYHSQGLPLMLNQPKTKCFKFGSFRGEQPLLMFNQEYLNLYPKPDEFLCQEISKTIEKYKLMVQGVENPIKSHFIMTYLLPKLSQIPRENQINLLKLIRDTFSTFSSKDIQTLMETNVVPMKNGELVKINQLYNPTSPLLKMFMDQLLPPSDLRSPEWINFFQSNGMKDHFDINDFLKQATLVSNQYSSLNDKSLLTSPYKEYYLSIGTSLFANLEKINSNEIEPHKRTIENLYIVPCKLLQYKGVEPNQQVILSTLSQSVNEEHANTSYLAASIRSITFSRFVTDPIGFIPIQHFIKLLKSQHLFTGSYMETAFKHFTETLNRISNYSKNIYHYMSTLRSLEYPIPIQDKIIFLPSSSIIFSSNGNLEPYFYTLPYEWNNNYHSFFSSIGVQDLSTQVIIDCINNQDPHKVLGDVQLVGMMNLFSMLIDKDTSGLKYLLTIENMLIDRELVYNCSIEIENRIHLNRISIIHPKLLEYKFIVPDIFTVVKEVLDKRESVWELNYDHPILEKIQSPIFLRSFKRLLLSKYPSEQQRIEIIEEFGEIRIILADIVSQFIYTPSNGEPQIDITKEPSGSQYLYDKSENVLYLNSNFKNNPVIPLTELLQQKFGLEAKEIVILLSVPLEEIESIMNCLNMKIEPNQLLLTGINPDANSLQNSVNRIRYHDNTPYSQDPIAIHEPNNSVLIYNPNNNKMESAIILEHDLEQSTDFIKYYYVRTENSEVHHVLASDIYPIGHTVPKYDNQVVQQFVKEWMSSGLPQSEIERVMDRVRVTIPNQQNANDIIKNTQPSLSTLGKTIPQERNITVHFQSYTTHTTYATNSYSGGHERSGESGGSGGRSGFYGGFYGNMFSSAQFTPNVPDPVLANAYWKCAEKDLKATEECTYPSNKCFHSQQVVEKALKAILLEKGISFNIKSHSIASLLMNLGDSSSIPTPIQSLTILDSYYITSRYPTPTKNVITFSESEAKQAVQLATIMFNVKK